MFPEKVLDAAAKLMQLQAQRNFTDYAAPDDYAGENAAELVEMSKSIIESIDSADHLVERDFVFHLAFPRRS